MRGGLQLSHELEEHYTKIYKYCYFKTKNVHHAEDLTQETFTRYFSQNTYINRGKTLSYLYTIAKNLCVDSYRKEETLQIKEEDIVEYTINKFESDFTLRQAIVDLPDELQELLLLRYSNELNMKEISGITGLSRFAVYRRINDALGRLRKKLKEEDFR